MPYDFCSSLSCLHLSLRVVTLFGPCCSLVALSAALRLHAVLCRMALLRHHRIQQPCCFVLSWRFCGMAASSVYMLALPLCACVALLRHRRFVCICMAALPLDACMALLLHYRRFVITAALPLCACVALLRQKDPLFASIAASRFVLAWRFCGLAALSVYSGDAAWTLRGASAA